VKIDDWLRAERLAHDLIFDLNNYAQGVSFLLYISIFCHYIPFSSFDFIFYFFFIFLFLSVLPYPLLLFPSSTILTFPLLIPTFFSLNRFFTFSSSLFIPFLHILFLSLFHSLTLSVDFFATATSLLDLFIF
jgi:hypothetical protein